MTFLSNIFVLAQEEAGNRPGGIFETLGPPFMVIIVLYFVLVVFPQQNDRKKRTELLNNLKKNDRVLTKSGMIGTVVNFSGDGNEITLKVDDNCRIRFLRSAIDSVLVDEGSANKTES